MGFTTLLSEMQVVKRYPAKLLLYGEHTVLTGSHSLAIPYPHYHMSWIKSSLDHPKWLVDYMLYIEEHCSDFLDLDALDSWTDQYTIAADIPIGYGLGSSGALTAAIYDVAHEHWRNNISLVQLQQQLGLMESFFHGHSSGLDPMISLLRSPIFNSASGSKVIERDTIFIPVHCYLLDSLSHRSGRDMIERFRENCASKSDGVQDLVDANNSIISQSFESKANIGRYYATLKSISTAQQSFMPYMIIDPLRELWAEGLKSDDYYIKICGAGGGGYYLVFSIQPLSSLGAYPLQRVGMSHSP